MLATDIQNMTPAEYAAFKKDLNRRVAKNILGFVAVKVVIAVGVSVAVKKLSQTA